MNAPGFNTLSLILDPEELMRFEAEECLYYQRLAEEAEQRLIEWEMMESTQQRAQF